MRIFVAFAIFASSYSGHLFAADPQTYSARLFDRLVGVPIAVESPMQRRMKELIAANDLTGAAHAAMEDQRFYSIRVHQLVAPMTNVDGNPHESFNDLQALMMGVIRDDLDARLILTGDFRYEGYRNLGLPAVSRSNNDHYREFEKRGYSFWERLTRVNDQWPEYDVAAGAFTTRAWGKAFYSAGTNRRSVKHAFQTFLCTPIEQWRDIGLPDRYVRRDVNRLPSGNPANYQNECRTCHAGMDSLGGAFARMDYVNDALTYLGADGIAEKYKINTDVYPEGYDTTNDQWVNQSTRNHNQALGWRGQLSGNGVVEFAAMIANSKAFSKCWVKRSFKEVCQRPITANEDPLLESFADQFEANNYNIKNLIANIVTHESCLSHD